MAAHAKQSAHIGGAVSGFFCPWHGPASATYLVVCLAGRHRFAGGAARLFGCAFCPSCLRAKQLEDLGRFFNGLFAGCHGHHFAMVAVAGLVFYRLFDFFCLAFFRRLKYP